MELTVLTAIRSKNVTLSVTDFLTELLGEHAIFATARTVEIVAIAVFPSPNMDKVIQSGFVDGHDLIPQETPLKASARGFNPVAR